MINYETNNSPFFEANKKYCEAIENQLKSFNYEYAGFCNSYGYEIESTFIRNSFSFHLKFIKHQTTRNGVVVPVDAADFAGIELEIKGLNPTTKISFGKNKLKRLFSSKDLMQHIPTPYYFSTNLTTNKQSCIQLSKLLLKNNIDSLKINRGKAILKIISASTASFKFINELEIAIVNCSYTKPLTKE